MGLITYIKPIVNMTKLIEQIQESSMGTKFDRISSVEDTLYIHLTATLSTSEETVLDDIVNNFIDFTTAEQLKIYLDESVFPFINNLINRFAAENIAMGITQAGKTGIVLGLFEKQYDIYNNGFPISLKGSFDTGSLYESIGILTYIAANPAEIAGLDPFVSVDRLNAMKADIIDFLT